MGGFFSRLKQLFTGLPDEFNDTNANIQKYHEMQMQVLEIEEKAELNAADAKRWVEESALQEAEAKNRKRKLSREN